MRHSILYLPVLFLLALAASIVPATAAPPAVNKPTPGFVRVRLETSAGPIVLALDARRAPKTTANFLDYVDEGRLDGTTFYRASRRGKAQSLGFIQGGIAGDTRRALPPVEHEPTSQTGILNLDATVSMARGGQPGSAMGNFFIMVGAVPHMDARPGSPGYAAFGHVVAGMDTVRRILALPTGGGTGQMRGQMILKPVTLISARRLDGVGKPAPIIKPWLFKRRP